MRTWTAKKDSVKRNWWIVDATDQTVGHLATKVASVLRGKHKAEFTPHMDTGDFVVVINSDKVRFTGDKWNQKKYYRHSGFFGGIKELSARAALEKDSRAIVKTAVRGMLPRGPLGYQQLTKLKIFCGPEHNHGAQKPETLTV